MSSSTSSQKSLSWDGSPFAELLRLAWPISASMLSYSVMTLVDTLFVGRLGPSALAGVSIGGVISFALVCFGFGGLRSVKMLVSQSVGAGQQGRAVHYVGAGLMLAAALGVLSIAAGWIIAPQLWRLMETPQSGAHAESYVFIRTIGAPFFMGASALREGRYGIGDSRSPMRAALCVNFLNIGLDYLFIIQFNWGVEGAGWATVICQGADLVLLALVQRRDGFGLGRKALRELPTVWRETVPPGAQMALELGAFTMLTAIFASLGDIALSAHQIVLQVAHLSFLPALAVGEAASVMAGQAVGAGRDDLVRPVARRALVVAASYNGLCGLVFALAGAPIARAFNGDAQLVATATSLFIVAALFQVFDGANIVARSVLRGTGDVRVPAAINVGLAWAAGPPVAYLLAIHFGFGVVGGWCALSLEIIAGAFILWWRLERSRWLSNAEASRRRLDEAVPDSLVSGPQSVPHSVPHSVPQSAPQSAPHWSAG